MKGNELPNHEKTHRNLKRILLSKRSKSEKATYCIVPTIGHDRKGKTMKIVKKISGCQGFRQREGGRDRGRKEGVCAIQEIFRAVNYSGTIMVDTTHYTFVKPIKCTSQKGTPNINHRLLLNNASLLTQQL